MKSIALIFFILAGSFSFGQTKAYKKMLKKYYNDFPTVSISVAYANLKADNAVFLDIREKREYNVSHIKGAIQNSPDGDLSAITSNKAISKDDLIIVYCSVGARSQTFGEKLKAAGYTNVKNMYGGLFLWANREYPMLNNKGARTTNIHGYSKDWGKWVRKGKVVY